MVYEPSFQPEAAHVPPQNVEAEELILGGILLDPEAIGRVTDLLSPDAFYLSAHQEIYRAALALNAQGSPTDLMCMTAWLQDHNLLEKIGGQKKLGQLVDRTVSAVNVDQYGELIKDKFLRRQLIKAANEIAQSAYDTAKKLEVVLDQAEQRIFGVTQDRVRQGLVATEEILASTFAELEQRSLGEVLPGLSCGFYDLDAMTQGFQRSDLVIVAGRPSMGKCLAFDSEIVLADGRVATIAEIYQWRQARLLTLQPNWRFGFTEPSAFIDDGLKPVFRIVTRLGKSITTTLTHPFLTLAGWQPLAALQPGAKIAVPRRMAVFGNQTRRNCEVKLLAYLIGDGGLTDSNPEFTNINPQIQEDFRQAVHEFGPHRIRLEDAAQTRTPTLIVSADAAFVHAGRQTFGQRLRQILTERCLSNTALAAELGVSFSLVGQWLKGLCVPHAQQFEQLCCFLDISPEWLIPCGLTALAKEGCNQLKYWLKAIGLWGKKAHEKTIPELVFQLPRLQLALFLNRLFATDGWATVLASGQSQIGYCSVSETLARQVQHLLLRFGIIAALKQRRVKYKEGRRTAWQLDITDAIALQTFIQEIGIFGKEVALAQVQQALSQRRYQTNRDLIPVEVWVQLAQAKGQESWQALAQRAGIRGYSNIHVGQRALSRQRLADLATALVDQPLQELAASEVYWDEIVSIEPLGMQQVYDLTIPETHNFVANDICVHNTALSVQIARQISEIHRMGVAIFSLEMSKEQLVQRLLASESGIDSNYLRAGRIHESQWEPLSRAIGTLSQLPIYIDDSPNPTINEIRSSARRLQAERGDGLGLILLDYLQLMGGGDATDGRVQELSRITRSLKALARELHVPIIALSQLSRGVEARTNKRPLMSDLRESGAIEQDADLIVLLYRDDYYNPDSPEKGICELILAKHRNGPVGTVKLLFQPGQTKFFNLAKQS
jgi:replicative DNA helicase